MKLLLRLQRYGHKLDSRAEWWHQRPVYGLLIGLISGVFLGTSTALLPQLIAAILLAFAVMWWPWLYRHQSYWHLRSCGRVLLVGLTSTHLLLSWQQRALPSHHIAHHLPNLQ